MSEETTIHDRREAADCRPLADLFRFTAAYFLKGPDPSTEGVLADPEWCAAVVDSGLVPAEVMGMPAADSEEHKRHFMAMFRIPGGGFIPPFEQAYREGKATVDDAAVSECLQVYAAAGYQLPPFKHVQADHIGHQTRFLAAVLEQEADCLDRSDDESAATVSTWYTGFHDEHCGWWADFAGRVERTSPCRQIRIATSLLASLAAMTDGG